MNKYPKLSLVGKVAKALFLFSTLGFLIFGVVLIEDRDQQKDIAVTGQYMQSLKQQLAQLLHEEKDICTNTFLLHKIITANDTVRSKRSYGELINLSSNKSWEDVSLISLPNISIECLEEAYQ